MLLTVHHRTEYSYDQPVGYGLTRLRLVPRSGPLQRVRHWALRIEGAEQQAAYRDHFGNEIRLLSTEGNPHRVTITASGQVETEDRAGVYGPHRRIAPLWLFRQATALTNPGPALRDLVAPLTTQGLVLAHDLMAAVGRAVAYRPGETHAATTAEDALSMGHGVCQDHAQIFVSAARLLGLPARYVSGYLRMTDRDAQTATHAWAEAHIDGLGWVGFDVSNQISPDDRYVRIATGRDYSDAAPIAGCDSARPRKACPSA